MELFHFASRLEIDFLFLPFLFQRKELQFFNFHISEKVSAKEFRKESESNDILLHFVEYSNVHNSDRRSNATQSNVLHKNALKITLDPGSFVE